MDKSLLPRVAQHITGGVDRMGHDTGWVPPPGATAQPAAQRPVSPPQASSSPPSPQSPSPPSPIDHMALADLLSRLSGPPQMPQMPQAPNLGQLQQMHQMAQQGDAWSQANPGQSYMAHNLGQAWSNVQGAPQRAMTAVQGMPGQIAQAIRGF